MLNAPLPTGFQSFDVPEGLSAIHSSDCTAVIWQRDPLPHFQSWIGAIEPHLLPRAKVIAQAQQVHEIASQICEACGTPDSPERELLIDDVAALADIFSQLMDSAYVMLRLESIENGSHADIQPFSNAASLLCAYRGTGLRYDPSYDSNDRANAFMVPTGSPVLFQTSGKTENHRSRLNQDVLSEEERGNPNLLLWLDVATNPNGNADPKLVH